MTLKTERLYLLSPDVAGADRVAEYLCRNREFMEEFEPAREEAYYSVSFQEEALTRQTKDWRRAGDTAFIFPPRPGPG